MITYRPGKFSGLLTKFWRVDQKGKLKELLLFSRLKVSELLNLVIDNMTTDQRPQTAFLGTRIIEGWEKRVSRGRYFKRGIQTICWCKIRWHSNPSFETKSCDPKTWQIAFDGDLQIAINRIPSNLLVEKLLADKKQGRT